MKALQRAVGPYGREADQAKLRAMGKAVAPTTLHILRNWDPYVSGALFDLYAEWGFREAAPDLLAALLRFPSGAGAYAAVPAARLDPKLARPQLEPLANKQLTPAAALALLGQRRAVPLVMAQLRRVDPPKMAHVSAGLAAVTGKRFHTWAEWVRWWRDEGSKQTWQ